MRRLGWVALAAVAAAGCGGLDSHDVELTIGAGNALSPAARASIQTLEVDAATDGHGASKSYPLGRPLGAAERILLRTTSNKGTLAVGVVATDGSGQPVGTASGTVTLDDSGPHKLTMSLLPVDASGSFFSLSPTTFTLFTGQTVAFTASLDATWSVQEGDSGGTIDDKGLYTAPATSGTYHVVASSKAFFGRTATAEVTVLGSGVTLFAGQLGGGGFADGLLGTGRLNDPLAMISDGKFIYFTTQDKMLRKIDVKTGALTTIAGALDLPAPIDGTGGAAHFADPHQLALDGQGNLYVADGVGNIIRKVVIATGQVSTFAGMAGSPGLMEGTGTAARLQRPYGLAWDGARTLYFTDAGNCSVGKIDLMTAAVTYVAGTLPANPNPMCGHVDGTGAGAQLAVPTEAAFDGQGNLYVLDNIGVRKMVVASGAVTSFSANSVSQGLTSDGNGGLWAFSGYAVQFNAATGMATIVQDTRPNHTGNLYLGAVSGTIAPDGTKYFATTAAIYSFDPAAIAITLIGGVEPYSNPFQYGPSVVGALPGTRFNFVNGLDVGPDGMIRTRANDGWVRIDPMTGTSTMTTGALSFPCCNAMAFDGKSTVYAVAYDFTFRAIPVDPTQSDGDGQLLAGVAGMPGFSDGTGGAAKFNFPYGLALDLAHGSAYIADTNNSIIRKVVLATGETSTFLGTAGMAGYLDDVGTAARLGQPRALVYDGDGILYFGDGGHIRKATVPGGLVSTVAGSNAGGSADGPPGTGQLYSPNGMTLDAAKKFLYVTDQLNNTVRKIDLATGVISTVAGQVGHAVDIPGPLPATLNQPTSIAFSPLGDLLVATQREQSILQIRLP